jgi:hypothetical protein
MIFKNTDIDDNLLVLAKSLKTLTNKEIHYKIDQKNSFWIFEINEWLSYNFEIHYLFLDKKKYIIFSENEELSSYVNINQLIVGLKLFYFMDNGIEDKVLKSLAERMKTMTMQEAVDAIAKDPKYILTRPQMQILKVSERKQHLNYAKKFGL